MNNNADTPKNIKADSDELSIIEELSSIGELDLEIETQKSNNKPDEILEEDFEDMDLLDDFDIQIPSIEADEDSPTLLDDVDGEQDLDSLNDKFDEEDFEKHIEEIEDSELDGDLLSNESDSFDNEDFTDTTPNVEEAGLNGLDEEFGESIMDGFDDIDVFDEDKGANTDLNEFNNDDLFGEVNEFDSDSDEFSSSINLDDDLNDNNADSDWGGESFENDSFMNEELNDENSLDDFDSNEGDFEPKNSTAQAINNQQTVEQMKEEIVAEPLKQGSAFTNITSQIMSENKKEERPVKTDKVKKENKVSSKGPAGSNISSIIVASLVSSAITGGAIIFGTSYLSPSTSITLEDVNDAIAIERNSFNLKLNKVKQDFESKSDSSSVANLIAELEKMRANLEGVQTNFENYNSKLGHLSDLVEETQTSYKTLTAQRLGDLNDITAKIDKISLLNKQNNSNSSVDEKSIKAIFALKNKIDQIAKESNDKLSNLELIINKSNSENKLELLKAKEQLRAELEIVKKISEKTDLSIKALKASVSSSQDLNKTQSALGLDAGLNIVKAEKRKNYKVRGFSNNKVFIEVIDENGKQKIIPFTNNDYLDGYGKITRIDPTTKTIMTESGIVKIN